MSVDELTVAGLQRALAEGALTCVELVAHYLARIEAYDRGGPALNSTITLNPRAEEEARRLDEAFRRNGPVGPLHGVPLLLKDNIDTAGVPTSAGSPALAGTTPRADAFLVGKARAAGALVLAKSNMDELARGSSGYSSVGGQTRNPYAPDRIPGGSSGGTAAGVAANLGLAGIGTETGVSLRNPAATNGIVAIAPSRGLVSRRGLVPISFTQDRAGPLARTVADAALLLGVIAGYDPMDSQTSLGVGHGLAPPGDDSLGAVLAGARAGVVHEFFGDAPEEEASTRSLVDAAVKDLAAAGTTVVDDVRIVDELDSQLVLLDPLYRRGDTPLLALLADTRTNQFEFATGIDAYLAGREAGTVPRSLDEIVERGLHGAHLEEALRAAQRARLDDPGYVERLLRASALQRTVLQVMARRDLEVLVMPVKTRTAPLIGAPRQPGEIRMPGNALSSVTGFPSVVVPAGFTEDGLPVGLEFVGRPFTDGRLVDIAAAYEALTRHRRPPGAAPPLGD